MDELNTYINQLEDLDKKKFQTIIKLIKSYQFSSQDLELLVRIMKDKNFTKIKDMIDGSLNNGNSKNYMNVKIDEIHEIKTRGERIRHVYFLIQDLLDDEQIDFFHNYINNYINNNQQNIENENGQSFKGYPSSYQEIYMLGSRIRGSYSYPNKGKKEE